MQKKPNLQIDLDVFSLFALFLVFIKYKLFDLAEHSVIV